MWSAARVRMSSRNDRESFLLEMRIEREGVRQVALAHRDERHGVDEAQEPLPPIEQKVEAGVVKRLVDPDDLEQRREVRSKASNRVETEAPADQGIGFDQDERRRHERRVTFV